jgi:MFS transporter, OFA family, oxalate/formate antiporter
MHYPRWLFILQSFLMMLLLGTVYAYSVLRVEVESVFLVKASYSGLPYMVSLVSYAGMMWFAGRFLAKYRASIVIIGSTLLVSGLFLSALAGHILVLTLTYGVLVGSGVGLLYGVPIFLVQQTATRHTGLESGLILMGFGLSSAIMTPLLNWLLSMGDLSMTLYILGWIALVVLGLTISPLFRIKISLPTMNPNQTPYNRSIFFSLYIVFVLSLIAGLMMIGLTYRIGVTSYRFDSSFVTFAMVGFALINGITRPFFGWLFDRFGFFKVAFIALCSLILSGLLSLWNGGSQPIIFAISFALFWFGVGNWMALAPLAIKTLFSPAWFSYLYGLLFTGYGLAAIIGTLFSGAILDLTNTTWPLYAFIVLINLINLLIVLKLKKQYHISLL